MKNGSHESRASGMLRNQPQAHLPNTVGVPPPMLKSFELLRHESSTGTT